MCMSTKGRSGGMFAQRVKAAWPCLGLEVQSEQAVLVSRFMMILAYGPRTMYLHYISALQC